ncbi:hypothetical protein [Paracerasibacillus soli]|uniref:Uncharacterized protein n=1 Tax=Paracerasibacillus soli TaxID=480284 RepID=A0ABU5CV17_9BACI|nr:hypothetical protein [Virgibacillus soli]MDY0409676.1 hypothetical protein [Virgibacillus soli]
MNQHFLTIEQFDQLLKNWHGKDIQIQKIEMDDVDHIQLQLEQITYAKDLRRNMDDYVSRYTMQLNGDGKF